MMAAVQCMVPESVATNKDVTTLADHLVNDHCAATAAAFTGTI